MIVKVIHNISIITNIDNKKFPKKNFLSTYYVPGFQGTEINKIKSSRATFLEESKNIDKYFCE